MCAPRSPPVSRASAPISSSSPSMAPSASRPARPCSWLRPRGALAQIAPDRVFACEVGGDTGVSFGGYDRERRPFVFLEFLFGSWGGRPAKDGVDACSSSVVNFSNNPIEVIESEYPLRIERYGYVPDSGGAGEDRGGAAVVRPEPVPGAAGPPPPRT